MHESRTKYPVNQFRFEGRKLNRSNSPSGWQRNEKDLRQEGIDCNMLGIQEKEKTEENVFTWK